MQLWRWPTQESQLILLTWKLTAGAHGCSPGKIATPKPRPSIVMCSRANPTMLTCCWAWPTCCTGTAKTPKPCRFSIRPRPWRPAKAGSWCAAEARSSFRQALAIHGDDQAARLGLEALAGESRHQFRIGTEVDSFNYVDTA